MPLHPNWVFSAETSWTMKERVHFVHDDDFEIQDEEGNVVIEAKGASMWRGSSMKDSYKDGVTFTDARTGEELFKIVKKMWEWTPSYRVVVKGQTVAVMSKKLWSFSDGLKVYGGEDKSAPILFTVKQPWVCGPFKVGYSSRRREYFEGEDTDSDPVANTKEKRCNAGEICGGDEYEVEIDEGVDALMVFAVTVALDQMLEDEQK